ncbi:MAG: hypothetical protein JNL79_07445 [Myxococcales bacterium]|nr:hypothetical protein [Myxococcales bacterium]
MRAVAFARWVAIASAVGFRGCERHPPGPDDYEIVPKVTEGPHGTCPRSNPPTAAVWCPPGSMCTVAYRPGPVECIRWKPFTWLVDKSGSEPCGLVECARFTSGGSCSCVDPAASRCLCSWISPGPLPPPDLV